MSLVSEQQSLGELTPLRVSRTGRLPDRRDISVRWLVSAVLVGMTSLFLMGGALFAALDGRQQLALPAQAYEKAEPNSPETGLALKGNHPGIVEDFSRAGSKLMMVSTVSRAGNENVVKVRPFLNIRTSIARAPKAKTDYPSFNPLTVFSDTGESEIVAKSSDLIYGADVEGEVKIKISDFPYGDVAKISNHQQQPALIEEQVRRLATNLNSDSAAVSALSYFDFERFSLSDQTSFETTNMIITAENVSTLHRQVPDRYRGIHYRERLIEIRAKAEIAKVFETEGLTEQQSKNIETILSSDLGAKALKPGDRIQVYYQIDSRQEGLVPPQIARLSLYRGTAHLVSIARTDNNQFVYAIDPKTIEPSGTAQPKSTATAGRLPTVYDGIYSAALAEDLTVELTSSLIKILAFDVDFKSRTTPGDELAVFVSLEEGEDRPTDESEILYVSLNLRGLERRYYRYRDEESGRVDYYDETGKSAKKFLLRKPVPNGRFKSAFGHRRHPISGVRKMHWGADWAAPRGTPILAAGNGIVEKAGWSGGYGRQTIIRHANGYKTSYSHQTSIRKGIRPGARVRQGQVIGRVGSTGYSTGPHLHYEVIVNGNKVDPMRIRLPRGKVLKDEELAAFQAERDRIDALLNQEDDRTTEVAFN